MIRAPKKAKDLKPSPQNPRVISDSALADLGRSMRTLGDLGGIVFNRRTGNLVGGTQRRRNLPEDAPITIAQRFKKPTEAGTVALGTVELEGEQFAYREVDWPPELEAAANIRANQPAGEWDEAMLGVILGQLVAQGDVGLTGLGAARVAQLLAAAVKAPVDDFDPTPPVVPVSQVGDLFELGPHRLLCGDATAPEDVARALGGTQARLLWTDPPYGVSYVGGTKARLTIQSDGAGETYALLRAMLLAVRPYLAPSSPFYIAAPAGPQGTLFRRAIEDEGWRFHQALVWVKDRFVLGHSDHHYAHEDVLAGESPEAGDPDHDDVLYGYAPGDGRPGRGRHPGTRWLGKNNVSTVFEVPRPKRSKEHPTMKPIELITRTMQNSAEVEDVVLDPFGGSGSTLIACELTHRRAVLIEKDPRYVDVIRRRYAEFAGRPDLMP